MSEKKEEFTDQDRLNWIAGMLAEYDLKIEYGIIPGCLCMSCHGYALSWENEDGTEMRIGHDLLRDAVDEGLRTIPNPWGF